MPNPLQNNKWLSLHEANGNTRHDDLASSHIDEKHDTFIDILVNSVPSLIFVYDLRNQNNLYLNNSIQTLLGYRPDEIQAMGKDFIRTLIHPDDVEALLKNTHRFKTCPPDTVFAQTYRIRSKDGKWHWLEDHSRVLNRDENGEPLTILGVASDITDRINALNELKNSESRNRSLFDDAPCPIFILDLQGRILRMNRTGAAYLNTTPETCAGQHLGELIQDFNQTTASLIEKVKKNRDIVEFFDYIDLPVGRRWFQARLRPLFSNDGEIEQIQVIAHDVSEAQKANEDMIRTHAELENMLASISDGFFACDRNFIITYFNEAAEHILQRKATEILGKNLFDAFPEIKGTALETNFRQALTTGNPIYFETFFKPPPYTNWYTVRVQPGERGIAVYFQVTTEAKVAEQELQRYAESQTALVREVNHRVKNNLATIQSLLNIELQRAKLTADIKYADTVNLLRSRIMGLSIVHSMLSECGWKPLWIGTIIHRIIAAAIEGVPHETTYTLNQGDESLTVDSDQAHHLALAINELTTNAIKYGTAKNPDIPLEINLSVESNDGYFCLVFRDNGPGFPSHVLEKPDKSGIGMELLYGLIQHSLRGRIQLKNEGGASVSLRIPKHN